MSESKKYVFDPGMGTSSILSLPVIEKLIDSVQEVHNYVSTKQMKSLKRSNIQDYRYRVYYKYKNFAEQYPVLFNAIVEENDITPFYQMMDQMISVNLSMKSNEEAERSVGDYLAKKYTTTEKPK